MEKVDGQIQNEYNLQLAKLRIDKPEPQELRKEYKKAYHKYRSIVLDSDTSSPYKEGIGQYYAKKEACMTYAVEVGIDLDAEDPPIDPAALEERSVRRWTGHALK